MSSRALDDLGDAQPLRTHVDGSVYGLNQWSSSAIPAQNPSRSESARAQIASYSARLLMRAAAANSAGGSNNRCSTNKDSMFFSDMISLDARAPRRRLVN
jgi:hypothetical protein